MRDFFAKIKGHFLPDERNAYRPHLLRRPWLLFFLTIVLTAEGLYAASFFAKESVTSLLSAVVPGEVIALTNVERGKVGDGALAENTLLDRAAQAKADDMALKGYFSHTGPDGKEPWAWISEAGYTYRYAGENLAVRFDQSSDVVNAWMASPTHRANIVKPQYTEIGIGVAQGSFEGSPATFIVQYFGTPQEAAAALAPVQPTTSEPALESEPASSEVAGASTEEAPAAHAPTTTAPQGAAAAPEAQTNTNPGPSVREELQSFARASDASQQATQGIIGGIALLLVILIALAVFVHIEIQPTELLMGGAFVGAVAVSLFMLNASFNNAAAGESSQPAAAAGAFERSILVGEGASTEAVR